MSVRKTGLKLGMATVAVASVALTAVMPSAFAAGPDSSDVVPGQNSVAGTFTLGSSVVGVGSDTTQWVMNQLTKDYNTNNATAATPTPYIANFDACLGNTTAGAPGLGDNPDGSGFPCGADHTGTQAGVKRKEDVINPALSGSADGSLPSGSGDGRTLLRTPSDSLFNDVAFGRSSGPINTTDLNAGEIALPFAVDKIVVVTHPGGPAPAALSGQQILKIYNGTYTNWNQVGGANAPIHPYMPKSGSSTLNAFMAFLAALDGTNESPGSDNDPSSHSAAYQTWQGPGNVTTSNWNTGTVKVEEHDPSVVINDPNAIEPFSYGRAQLANGGAQTVRIEGGWSADRELYNVLRSKAISGVWTPFIYGDSNAAAPVNTVAPAGGGAITPTDPGNFLEGIFGKTGYICTNSTAQNDIAASGFWPLTAGSNVGNCGVANNNTVDSIDAYRSYGVGEGSDTSTNVAYYNGSVNVTVAARDGSTPTGSVQVTVTKAVGAGLPTPAASYSTEATLTNGAVAVQLPGSLSGASVIDVSYLPTGFGQNGSAGHDALGSSFGEVNATIVSSNSSVSGSVPTVAYGKAHAVTASVAGTYGTSHATGSINLSLKGVNYSGTLNSSGVATIAIPTTIAPGSYTGSLTYAGDANFGPGQGSVKVTVTKAATSVSSTQSAYAYSTKAYSVAAKVNRVSGAAVPTGIVGVYKGTVRIGYATLSGGKATVHVTAANIRKYLVKGRRTALAVKYTGSALYNGSAHTIYVTRR